MVLPALAGAGRAGDRCRFSCATALHETSRTEHPPVSKDWPPSQALTVALSPMPEYHALTPIAGRDSKTGVAGARLSGAPEASYPERYGYVSVTQRVGRGSDRSSAQMIYREPNESAGQGASRAWPRA